MALDLRIRKIEDEVCSVTQCHPHAQPNNTDKMDLKQVKEECETELCEERVTTEQGLRGIGWTTVEDIIIPYIMRGPSKYVAVRIIEAKLMPLLNGFNLQNLLRVGGASLYSFYITESEARLFTELNTKCFNQQFGSKPFSSNDLIINLSDLRQFYSRLMSNKQLKSDRQEEEGQELLPYPGIATNISVVNVEGGWVQINNTVVPYVFRNGVKFVPLNVIRHAGGLLNDVRIDGYKSPATDMECVYLNNACQTLELNFHFRNATELIKLELVIRLSSCKVSIKELCGQAPFKQATYQLQHVRMLKTSVEEILPEQDPSVFQIPCPLPHMLATDKTDNMVCPSSEPLLKSSVASTCTLIMSQHHVSQHHAQASNSRQIVIECRVFCGKTLPCLLRGAEEEGYALVESVMRLYFNAYSLPHLLHLLQHVMNVCISHLNTVEEQAFIRFYNLPVKAMRYKHIIRFSDLQHNFQAIDRYLASTSQMPSPNMKTSSQLDSQPKTESSSQLDSQPKTETSSQLNAQPKTESSSQLNVQPKTESSSRLNAQPKIKSSSQLEAQPKTESSSQLDFKPKVENSSNMGVQSKIGTPIQLDTQLKTKTEYRLDVKTSILVDKKKVDKMHAKVTKAYQHEKTWK